MLEGIQDATAIMDDILIAGRDKDDHYQIFRSVIERATRYNLKVIFHKCHVRHSAVPYVSHLITAEGLKPDPGKVIAIAEMLAPGKKEGAKRLFCFIGYLSKFI